mmetsp:Transcript_14115/g.28072  ORF Transcript_14115/g.28072 Transcript_14115/m.28072 type:complete len:228 (+) Transcript_14115:1201-1884(+)
MNFNQEKKDYSGFGNKNFFFLTLINLNSKPISIFFFFFNNLKKLSKGIKISNFPLKKFGKFFLIKRGLDTFPLLTDFGNGPNVILKIFFFFVKSFGKPRFSQEGENFLLFWYKRESLKKTLKGKEILLLEKLIRLSEAHARFLLQDFVLFNDCVLAFFLVHYSFVSNHIFIASDIFFDFSQTTLNIFSSFQQFSPFFFLRNFKVLGGLKGLAGGTLNIMKEKQGLSG